MATDQRGRRPGTGSKQKQPSERRTGGSVRQSGGKRANQTEAAEPAADAWQASVVFGLQETKMPVNIRLDADVVRFFRAGGAGYQTRINDVLKAFVQARIRAGDVPGGSGTSGARRKRP